MDGISGDLLFAFHHIQTSGCPAAALDVPRTVYSVVGAPLLPRGVDLIIALRHCAATVQERHPSIEAIPGGPQSELGNRT